MREDLEPQPAPEGMQESKLADEEMEVL